MTTQFQDYLVTYELEQWHDGERIGTDEIEIRVAGVCETSAAQGGQFALNQLDTVTDVEITNIRRDHDGE